MALKILLADDSMTAQNMGKKILAEAGYDIVAVSNGAAALKKIAELKPDIAILDVFMPGYTGPEVCERIKNVHETAKIPVLLTVGKMEMSAFKPEETNRVKADGLIIKPFEATDLISLIQKLEMKLAAASKPLPTAFESDDDTPQHEKTLKLDVREFRDAGYDEWKTNAQEHTSEDSPKKGITVPSEMAAGPAFMESVEEQAPVEVAHVAQILEKGQPAFLQPVAPDYSSTVQLPPPKPVASTSGVPDWAVPSAEPAAAAVIAAAAVEETPVVGAGNVTDAPSRETGVGKLLSKAKAFFGASVIDETNSMPAADGEAANSVKDDIQAAEPAEIAPPVSVPSSAPDWGSASAFGMEAPVTLEAAPEVPMAEVALEPVVGLEAAAHVDESTMHQVLEFEQTEAPQKMEIEHGIDPALDTMQRDMSQVASAEMDPALVTDPTEMASAFPTSFGMAGVAIDPVGVAADVPGLYDSDHEEIAAAQVAEAVAEAIAEMPSPQIEKPSSAWRAEEHHLEDHEHSVRLEQEMSQQYAAQPSAVAEPGTSAEVALAVHASAAPANAPDVQFAVAMAAAVGAEMPTNPSDGTVTMDPEMLERVVSRVTERMRPSLIAEITKELMSEQQKNKK